MICHDLGEQYGSCLDGLGARIGDKSSIGAFDTLDDSIGQFGTVANCMLTHTRQQIRARYSVWKSKEVMCRWDSGRPARPRIDDQRSSQKPAQIGGSRYACGTSANDNAVVHSCLSLTLIDIVFKRHWARYLKNRRFYQENE